MTAAEAPAQSSAKSGVLLVGSLVSSLIMLDTNIVAVSLPAIGRSFYAGFTTLQWVISAYVLTYAALLMAAGNFADLHGRRRAMLLGLAVFALASAVCGGAPTAAILNVARALQGVGGALLLTASLAVIAHDFQGDERAGAFAFWGASLGTARGLGPIIGGVITNFAGWRWIFLVNVPLAAILIAATLRMVEESKDPDAKELDFPGILTFSVGLALLVWGLIDGNDAGWTSLAVLARLCGAVLSFAAFVIVEYRQPRPMVDLALFRRRTFLGSVLAMIGYGASGQVMVFFLPLFLQNAYQLSPMQAGFGMLPFALPMVLAPRLTTKLGTIYSGRTLLTAGLAITLASNLLLWFVARQQYSYPVFLVAMICAGCGAGVLNGQTVKVIGGAVPPDRAGMASGLASTTRFIGILVSVAAMGAVLAHVVGVRLAGVARSTGLDALAVAAAARDVSAGNVAAAIHEGQPASHDAIYAIGLSAFSDGFAAACLLAAVIALTAAVLTFVFVSAAETAPADSQQRRPCKFIDCRDPL